MRDYSNIDAYLTELAGDVYAQPRDDGHDKRTKDLLLAWLVNIHSHENEKNVLDVGCGQGNASDIFDAFGWKWTGVTMGDDYNVCKEKGLNVVNADFSFLPIFSDAQFDMVFARHALEHSPMPLLTLMEWHRICRTYLVLVVPSVEKEIVCGLNHYVLMHKVQWESLLFRAGFRTVWEDKRDPLEYRLLCQRRPRPKPPYKYDQFIAEVVQGEGKDLRDTEARG